jgi:uncharacterized protein (DUF305 family)
MTRFFATTLAVAGVCLLAACGSKPPLPDDSHSGGSSTVDTAAAAVSQSGMASKNMAAMTGDPDHDFLRMMSDHHKGLIAMVHLTMESKENLSVKTDARQLDKKQDAELEKMVAMLDKQYKDDYTPKIIPDNQQMVDELKGKFGRDYSRTFLANVIKHHEQAVKMIDDYLPTARNAEVKSMAEKMKADQTKEIAKFQKELAAT